MNTVEVATAQMVTDTTVSFPEPAKLVARVERDTRRGANLYLDANWIAERISDDHLATNVVLTGAAFQHGSCPSPPAPSKRPSGSTASRWLRTWLPSDGGGRRWPTRRRYDKRWRRPTRDRCRPVGKPTGCSPTT